MLTLNDYRKLKTTRDLKYGDFDLIGYMYKEIVEDDTYGLLELQKHYGASGNNSIKTIVDIGANLGVFALRARELFPKARIISLEALGDTYEMLVANTQGHDIQAHHIALGDGSELYLNFCQDHSGANSFKKNGGSYKIKSKKLSEIFEQLKIEAPYVIKMDIEGGEMFLWEDSKHNLSTREILDNSLYFTMEYHDANMLGYRVKKDHWDEWMKAMFASSKGWFIDGLGGDASGALYRARKFDADNKLVYNDVYTKHTAYNHNVMYKYTELKKFTDTISGKILDAGCGEGWNMKKLIAEGKDVFGIEISDVCCEKFLKDLPHECTDIMSYAVTCYESKIRYDGLYCFDVLEHIAHSQIEDTLKALAVLAPRALLGIAHHSDIQFGHELHLIQEDAKWWKELLSKLYSDVNYIGCLGGNFYLFECK